MYDYYFFIEHDGKFILSMTGNGLSQEQADRMSAVDGCAYLVVPTGVEVDTRAIERAMRVSMKEVMTID